MTPVKFDIEYVKGDSHQVKVDGCPIVDKMYLTCRDKNGVKKFQKKYYLSGTSDGIARQEDGTYLITFLPADTNTLKVGNYNYDIEVIIDTIKQTLIVGEIKLSNEYTYAEDEV